MMNGDCMYRSMSLLYLNSIYYGKHDVFQSAYLSQKEPKRSPEPFFPLV